MDYASHRSWAVALTCSAPWLFRFRLLELVKGGYRGAKKGRGGRVRVECKGWNLTIDFLVVVLRHEGTRRVRMGNFLLQRGLLIYILALESCDFYMMTLLVR